MDTQQQQHALRPALVTEHDITDESCLRSQPEMTQVMSQDPGVTSRTAVSSASAQNQAANNGSLTNTGITSSAQEQAAQSAMLTATVVNSASAQKQAVVSSSVTAGREYYEDLCMKAVNQCVGRVIRHKGDYAAIVLADARWCSGNAGVAPNNGQKPVGPLRKLPTWIQGSLTVCRSFGDAYGRMHRFHRQMLASSMTE